MKTKTSNREIHKIPLFDSSGKKSDILELDKALFNGEFSEPLLYQALVMYRANMRRGTASTKTRSDVSGGGKKPWRQKGTGRARAGSIRSPLWRGGGIVFGPHPRDFRYSLPKKMKKKAFLSSLNAKLASGKVLAIEDMPVTEPKTKNVAQVLRAMKLEGKVLLLVKEPERNLVLAARNLANLTLKRIADTTALDVLSSEQVLMTKGAAESLKTVFKQ